MFLEKREIHMQRFCEEFKKLKVADEKQDLVDSFLNQLHTEMENDPIWQSKFTKLIKKSFHKLVLNLTKKKFNLILV